MGRIFFPTYSLNRFGVRDTDQRATLAGIDGLGAADRFYQEPAPRAAMNATPPMLGAVPSLALRSNGGGYPYSDMMIRYAPISTAPRPPIVTPIESPISAPTGAKPPVASSGGGGSVVTAQPFPVPSAAPTPVSQQVLPTPSVNVSQQPAPTGAVLVSSGGGVAIPATSTLVAPAPAAPAPALSSSTGGLVDGVAAWLGNSTQLLGYNVPNALIAGVVVLGFAWLSSSGRKR